jgi:hypothetical protein
MDDIIGPLLSTLVDEVRALRLFIEDNAAPSPGSPASARLIRAHVAQQKVYDAERGAAQQSVVGGDQRETQIA